MVKGPVACPSLDGPDYGTDGGLDRDACREDPFDLQVQGKPQGVRFRPNTEGEGRKGRLLPHLLPVRCEAVDVPVSGRREVELPVAPGTLTREKEFQTGRFPEAVPPFRFPGRWRHRDFRQAPGYVAAERQDVSSPVDRSGDLQFGREFLSRKWLKGKDPAVRRPSLPAGPSGSPRHGSYRRCRARRFANARSSIVQAVARSRHLPPRSIVSRSLAEPHRRSKAGTPSTNS